MLVPQRVLARVADGTVTLAVRRWRRPTVRTGGTLVTPVGVLSIDEVSVVDEHDITDVDAVRAGYATRTALLDELGTRPGELYRVAFHLRGPDPRIALRQRDELTGDDAAELGRRLGRLDRASHHGPWTRAVLALIAERPGTRAGDLADVLGQGRLEFKADVRKLKALGLTESLPIGYRLSPRGRAWLDRDP